MSAAFSPALAGYLLASRLLAPLGPWLLRRRAARGKEDPARLAERLGHASAPRPAGRLVWVHAASVGESLSALGLIAALRERRPDVAILMTAGTRTALGLLAERLPPGAILAAAPLDLAPSARRFLDHWRPDLAVWVESELWPGLIEGAARRGGRLALVNARVSERSADRWRRAPGMIRRLLGRFDVLLAADAGTEARLAALGAPRERLRRTGSLKAGTAPPDRPEAREALARAAGGRPLWLAASTHPGEEAAAAQAHRAAAAAQPGLLTLIAPRHPERGPEIAAALAAEGLRVTRRGAGEGAEGAEVHLLDTLGEMGAWFRLAPVAFVGGSLVPVGGHNPHEPAALGAAILHGPQVANFAEAHAALHAAGAAREVADGEALGREVAALLADPEARAAMTAAAPAALGDAEAALEATLAALLPLLPEEA